MSTLGCNQKYKFATKLPRTYTGSNYCLSECMGECLGQCLSECLVECLEEWDGLCEYLGEGLDKYPGECLT